MRCILAWGDPQLPTTFASGGGAQHLLHPRARRGQGLLVPRSPRHPQEGWRGHGHCGGRLCGATGGRGSTAEGAGDRLGDGVSTPLELALSSWRLCYGCLQHPHNQLLPPPTISHLPSLTLPLPPHSTSAATTTSYHHQPNNAHTTHPFSSLSPFHPPLPSPLLPNTLPPPRALETYAQPRSPQYANRLGDLLEGVFNGNQIVATAPTHIMEDPTQPQRHSTVHPPHPDLNPNPSLKPSLNPNQNPKSSPNTNTNANLNLNHNTSPSPGPALALALTQALP